MTRAKIPWAIKYTLVVNILFIVGFVICSLMAGYLGFAKYYPELFLKAKEMGIQLDSKQFSLLFVASIVMWLLPIPVLLYINQGILNLRKNVKTAQVLVSLIFLIYFPFGTVLYGIVLYYFLIDQKTKDYFKGHLKNA